MSLNKVNLNMLNNVEIYKLVLKGYIQTFPNGFWSSLSNEEGVRVAIELIRYLIDDLLNYTREDILFNIDKEFILNNKLWTPCKLYFGKSAIRYVMVAYPDKYRPYEFLNSRIPQGFWKNKNNRIEAVRWLIEDKLGWNIDEVKDNFNRTVLSENGLGTLEAIYSNSYDILNEVYPQKINIWELKKSSVPTGYWEKKNNRIKAIKWMVEERLKFTKEQILHEIELKHFYDNGLSTLISKYYNKSISRAILEAYEGVIMPWEFKYHRWNVNDARTATIWLVNKISNESGKTVNYYDFDNNNLRYMLDKYYISSPKKALEDMINNQ